MTARSSTAVVRTLTGHQKGNVAFARKKSGAAIDCYSCAIGAPVPYERLASEMPRRAVYHLKRSLTCCVRTMAPLSPTGGFRVPRELQRVRLA